MKTVFFESLRYKLITKNDFYYGSCPDMHTITIMHIELNLLVCLECNRN